LRKPFEGQWRARRGEYRVRYTIDDQNDIVTVVAISHAATPTDDLYPTARRRRPTRAL